MQLVGIFPENFKKLLMVQIKASSAKSTSLCKVRRKESPIHLDMTPMVDLAFLLLTFFMLATVFSKPRVMSLDLPEQSIDPILLRPINARNALNFVLGNHSQVYWYVGEDFSRAALTDYSLTGIRKILLANRRNPQLWVFIKPDDASNYQNMVDALDEMTISDIQHYSFDDLSSADRKLVEGKVGPG